MPKEPVSAVSFTVPQASTIMTPAAERMRPSTPAREIFSPRKTRPSTATIAGEATIIQFALPAPAVFIATACIPWWKKMPWKPMRSSMTASSFVGSRRLFSKRQPAASTGMPKRKRSSRISEGSACASAYFVEAKLPPQIVTVTRMII